MNWITTMQVLKNSWFKTHSQLLVTRTPSEIQSQIDWIFVCCAFFMSTLFFSIFHYTAQSLKIIILLIRGWKWWTRVDILSIMSEIFILVRVFCIECIICFMWVKLTSTFYLLFDEVEGARNTTSKGTVHFSWRPTFRYITRKSRKVFEISLLLTWQFDCNIIVGLHFEWFAHVQLIQFRLC